MGIAEVLFIVFLILKLIGTIDWSWWAVTSPLWGVYTAVFVVFTLIGVSKLFVHPKF